MAEARDIFILGLSSDIGRELGRRYLEDGHRVSGTYRAKEGVGDLVGRVDLFPCDVTDVGSVRALVDAFSAAGRSWDVFIGAVGTEEPIGPFFEVDFDAWQRSLVANAIGQLRVLHALVPLRSSGDCACVFFTGAGSNDSAVNYSAYSASKILLVKMCEILAAECPEIHPVIVGPGIVRTKIHEQTLRQPERAGKNYDRVVRFLESGDPGVSHDEIYACVNWCIEAGELASGRNFSLVHDAWRDGGEALKASLRADPNQYKLRRSGNDRKIGE